MVYLSALLPFFSLVCAATIPVAREVHNHGVRSALPNRWYHDDDHPAHRLFRRQDATPTATNSSGPPQVGSPAWTAAYPSNSPDVKALPKAWTDALNAAVQAGKIPGIPQSTQAKPNTNPTYPNKLDPNSPQVCSGTYQCRGPDTIWDAPDGTLGLGFDDGPLPPSPTLYAFLRENNLHATHFFIGINILQYWQNFNIAFRDNQDDIAVHTWTHPYMTTLSNELVLAELAWTVQIIYDSTGGRLPRYWRPPYGDTDVRVTAIAKEVLGMTAIVWNKDTDDWSIGEQGGTTQAAVQANFKKWLTGPKSPGLIILEHELTSDTVNGFIQGYPLMKQNNWDTQSVARLVEPGVGAFWNSDNATAPVTSAGLLAGANNGSGIPTPSSSVATSTNLAFAATLTNVSFAASSTNVSFAASSTNVPFAASSSSSAGSTGGSAGGAQANKNAAFVLSAPALAVAGSAFGLLFGLIAT